MKTIEEIETKYKKDLANLETKKAIRLSVPVPITGIVCIHKDHTSVTYQSDRRFPEQHSLKEAFEIYQQYKPFIVDGKTWRDSCTSSQPPEINSCAKREFSKFLHTAHVIVIMHGGDKFASFNLKFFARIEGRLLGVSVYVSLPAEWMPTFYWSAGGHRTRGHWVKRKASIPLSDVISYSSGNDSYNYEYSWDHEEKFADAIKPYME